MTPKQKYDERKRLRAERLLREEQEREAYQTRKDPDANFMRLLEAFERLVDVAEFWADKQVDQ